MTKNIFMSYSRRELGFVDQLVGKLEEQGYGVWLDYRVLIPGSPWFAEKHAQVLWRSVEMLSNRLCRYSEPFPSIEAWILAFEWNTDRRPPTQHVFFRGGL